MELAPHPIGDGLVLLALGLSAFVPAARIARRWLRPSSSPPAARWDLLEVGGIAAFALLVSGLAARKLAAASFLEQLLANELVFGATAALVLVLASRRPGGLEALGVSARPSRAAWAAGPLGYAPLFVVMAGVGVLWRELGRVRGWPAEQEVMRAMLELEGGALVVGALVAVVVGPLLEELLFRGFLQSVLVRPLGSFGAVVVTALLFALLHGKSTFGPLFCLSLYLGWLRARSGTLWISWAVHALHNGLGLALALSFASG